MSWSEIAERATTGTAIKLGVALYECGQRHSGVESTRSASTFDQASEQGWVFRPIKEDHQDSLQTADAPTASENAIGYGAV